MRTKGRMRWPQGLALYHAQSKVFVKLFDCHTVLYPRQYLGNVRRTQIQWEIIIKFRVLFLIFNYCALHSNFKKEVNLAKILRLLRYYWIYSWHCLWRQCWWKYYQCRRLPWWRWRHWLWWLYYKSTWLRQQAMKYCPHSRAESAYCLFWPIYWRLAHTVRLQRMKQHFYHPSWPTCDEKVFFSFQLNQYTNGNLVPLRLTNRKWWSILAHVPRRPPTRPLLHH